MRETTRRRRAVPNPTTLADLGRLWADQGAAGQQAVAALTQWLDAHPHPTTQKVYRAAFLEFWQWHSISHGRTVYLPERVTEDEALRFVHYLRTRRVGLAEWRLDQDPARELDLRLYRYVKDHPGTRLESIRIAMGIAQTSALELERRLAQLVREHLLERAPRLAELRHRDPRAQINHHVEPSTFTYRVAERRSTRRGATITARVAALSSYWSTMGLATNPWRDALRTIQPEARASRREGATAADVNLLDRILATTERPDGQSSPQDLRDRAAVLLLSCCHVQVSELSRLTNGDLRGSQLQVTDWAGTVREVELPVLTQQALQQLQERLVQIEAHRAKRGLRSIHDVSTSGPLLPVLKRWGRVTQFQPTEARGISQNALAMALHQRALRAGLEVGSADYRRVHPSAFRHLRPQLQPPDARPPRVALPPPEIERAITNRGGRGGG